MTSVHASARGLRLALTLGLAIALTPVPALAGTVEPDVIVDYLTDVHVSDPEDIPDEVTEVLPGVQEAPLFGPTSVGGEYAGGKVPHPVCTATTLDPHVSGGTRASVHALTMCPKGYPVEEKYVRVKLYRRQWWGWDYKKTGTNTTTNAWLNADANAKWWCDAVGYDDYMGKGYHTVTDDGVKYVGETGNVKGFWC